MGYRERAIKYLNRKRKEYAKSQQEKRERHKVEHAAYRQEYQKSRIKALKTRARREGAASAQPFGRKLERFGSSVSRSMDMMGSALGGGMDSLGGFDPITGAPLPAKKKKAQGKKRKNKGKRIVIYVK